MVPAKGLQSLLSHTEPAQYVFPAAAAANVRWFGPGCTPSDTFCDSDAWAIALAMLSEALARILLGDTHVQTITLCDSRGAGGKVCFRRVSVSGPELIFTSLS